MNIQPNSSLLRKYIPPSYYFQLMDMQRHQSFIGMSLSHSNEQSISKRIEELEELEKMGFVYLGEKNWLQSYLADKNSPDFINYDQWVWQVFTDYLHLNFKISQDFDHLDEIIWEAELDASNLLLDFKELENPGFLVIDDLDVFVGGNQEQAHPAYLVKAFEFLHNLEYAVSTVLYKSKGHRVLSITGIDVSNPIDPGRWELNVISEYGSDWDFTIVNGKAWRFKQND